MTEEPNRSVRSDRVPRVTPRGFYPNAVREEHRDNVAPQDDQLVSRRQQVAVLREAAAERGVRPALGDGVAGYIYDGAGAHHAHGCILEGDVGDAESAVADQEPWGVVVPVAVEVEPRFFFYRSKFTEIFVLSTGSDKI